MCSIDSADPCDLYRSEFRTAAKPHACYECGNQIVKGDRYLYASMLYDGRWTTCHTCPHCLAAGRWLQLVCGGYLHGGLADELEEHWNEDPLYRSHWLGRAILGMRRRWWGMDPLPDPEPVLRLHGVMGSAS